VKLAIADPPYLGRGAMLYGPNARVLPGMDKNRDWRGKNRDQAGDQNPEAHVWDDPEKHRALALQLVADYDGWAIALNPDNLWHYLQWLPASTRVCSWTKPDAFPTGAIVRSWEPVLIHPARKRPRTEIQLRDSLIHRKSFPGNGRHLAFVGAKPPAWTRWVLDMLGYDPETDTVDDLFGGSGAVTAEINQQVLL